MVITHKKSLKGQKWIISSPPIISISFHGKNTKPKPKTVKLSISNRLSNMWLEIVYFERYTDDQCQRQVLINNFFSLLSLFISFSFYFLGEGIAGGVIKCTAQANILEIGTTFLLILP